METHIGSGADRWPAKRIPFGVGSWSFAWAIGTKVARPAQPLTAMDLLKKARELGVRLVQYADNLPLDTLPQPELAALRDAAREWGIEIQTGTRGIEPSHLLRYLEISTFLGSRLLRTMTGWPGEKPDLAQAAESVRRVLPCFAEAGVVMAFENYEIHRASELAAFIRNLDSPFAGVCLDTVNSLGALEGPEQVVNELAPFVLNVHIKDFAFERLPHMMGFSVVGRPAGSGMLDIPWLFRRLREAGRFPSAAIELWTPFTVDIDTTVRLEQEWAAESVRYLSGVESLRR